MEVRIKNKLATLYIHASKFEPDYAADINWESDSAWDGIQKDNLACFNTSDTHLQGLDLYHQRAVAIHTCLGLQIKFVRCLK